MDEEGQKGKVAWCYGGGVKRQGCKETGTTLDDKANL